MRRQADHSNHCESKRSRALAVGQLFGLYLIIDPTLTGGRDPLWIVEQAILGGVTAIQVRNKHGVGTTELVESIAVIAGDRATVIVNDFPRIAKTSRAGGVHLGQNDAPIEEARSLLYPWQIIGTSNALQEEVSDSLVREADYIAIGRMYATNSKLDTRPVGVEGLRAMRESVPVGGPPIVAIGGIDITNVREVAAAGADGICVISSVSLAPDPCSAASELLHEFRSSQA